MRWAGLCMGLGLLVSASAWAGEPIVVFLEWDPPTRMELSRLEPDAMKRAELNPSDVVDHYNVYLCGSNILAGGENADDPQVEAPVCVAGDPWIIQSTEPKTSGKYEVVDLSGFVYVRISAVTKSGRESRLSKEVSYAYNFERTSPPENPRFVEKEVAPTAARILFRR